MSFNYLRQGVGAARAAAQSPYSPLNSAGLGQLSGQVPSQTLPIALTVRSEPFCQWQDFLEPKMVD